MGPDVPPLTRRIDDDHSPAAPLCRPLSTPLPRFTTMTGVTSGEGEGVVLPLSLAGADWHPPRAGWWNAPLSLRSVTRT